MTKELGNNFIKLYLEQAYKQETMKISSSSEIYKTLYHNFNYYCYLERDNDKVVKFNLSNSLYFEIGASLF